MDLIPFSALSRPQHPLTQGVFIVLPHGNAEEFRLRDKITSWFIERSDVEVIDYGTTDKQGWFYMMVEWDGPVDPLFLAILDEELLIEDYTVYSRGEA